MDVGNGTAIKVLYSSLESVFWHNHPPGAQPRKSHTVP